MKLGLCTPSPTITSWGIEDRRRKLLVSANARACDFGWIQVRAWCRFGLGGTKRESTSGILFLQVRHVHRACRTGVECRTTLDAGDDKCYICRTLRSHRNLGLEPNGEITSMSTWFVEWIGPAKRGRITREVHAAGVWRGRIANGARLEIEWVHPPGGDAIAWRWWEKRGRLEAGRGTASTVPAALEAVQRDIARNRREVVEAEEAIGR